MYWAKEKKSWSPKNSSSGSKSADAVLNQMTNRCMRRRRMTISKWTENELRIRCWHPLKATSRIHEGDLTRSRSFLNVSTFFFNYDCRGYHVSSWLLRIQEASLVALPNWTETDKHKTCLSPEHNWLQQIARAGRQIKYN